MAMILPLYMKDVFGFATGLVAAVLIGFAFGFVLERAGFGRAKNLAAQFFLTDMRVFKVMFSAIVTAMLGVVVASNLGLLDMSAMQIPETFLWPQIVGGFVLGMGFMISAHCPGTAVVAAASGNMDGLVTVIGAVAGSLVFGMLPASMRDFSTAGAMGVYRLPELLHLPQAVVAMGITIMAVGCFVGAEFVEQWMARRKSDNPRPIEICWIRRPVFAAFLLVAGLGVMTMGLSRPAAANKPAPPAVGTITAIDLARRLIEDDRSVYVVDTRTRAAWQAAHIPGALPIENDDGTRLDLATLSTARTLVVYGTGDETPDVSGFKGAAVALQGGFPAFDSAALADKPAPSDATPEQIADYRLRSAFRTRFTGAAAAAPPSVPAKRVEQAPRKKGGGC